MKRKGEVIMKNLKKFAAMGMMAVMLVSSFGLTGCGVSKTEKIEGSAGLVYELSEDGTYYIFTDGKSCTDENIVIGNWHEENGKGLPVKGSPFCICDDRLREGEPGWSRNRILATRR